ncbi:MAG: hypothetical protein LBH38_01355 [Holosporales bacterium]|jgi:hypothetical protein|nr:hypothetical protein [Holosporales bacterium]
MASIRYGALSVFLYITGTVQAICPIEELQNDLAIQYAEVNFGELDDYEVHPLFSNYKDPPEHWYRDELGKIQLEWYGHILVLYLGTSKIREEFLENSLDILNQFVEQDIRKLHQWFIGEVSNSCSKGAIWLYAQTLIRKFPEKTKDEIFSILEMAKESK